MFFFFVCISWFVDDKDDTIFFQRFADDGGNNNCDWIRDTHGLALVWELFQNFLIARQSWRTDSEKWDGRAEKEQIKKANKQFLRQIFTYDENLLHQNWVQQVYRYNTGMDIMRV